jgi:Mor family transcriptional regulator
MEARDKSQAKAMLIEKAEGGNVAAMTKLYNISPKKIDNRLKKELAEVTPSNISEITERMNKG